MRPPRIDSQIRVAIALAKEPSSVPKVHVIWNKVSEECELFTLREIDDMAMYAMDEMK